MLRISSLVLASAVATGCVTHAAYDRTKPVEHNDSLFSPEYRQGGAQISSGTLRAGLAEEAAAAEAVDLAQAKWITGMVMAAIGGPLLGGAILAGDGAFIAGSAALAGGGIGLAAWAESDTMEGVRRHNRTLSARP